MGSLRTREKGFGDGFQIIHEFAAPLFYSKQNYTFREGGGNLGQICHFLRELLGQLPIGQIDSNMAVILQYH